MRSGGGDDMDQHRVACFRPDTLLDLATIEMSLGMPVHSYNTRGERSTV